MSNRTNSVEPGFALLPRGDVRKQTLEYLHEYFKANPDAVLTVTNTIDRTALLDFERGKRHTLGSLRGYPRKRRE